MLKDCEFYILKNIFVNQENLLEGYSGITIVLTLVLFS